MSGINRSRLLQPKHDRSAPTCAFSSELTQITQIYSHYQHITQRVSEQWEKMRLTVDQTVVQSTSTPWTRWGYHSYLHYLLDCFKTPFVCVIFYQSCLNEKVVNYGYFLFSYLFWVWHLWIRGGGGCRTLGRCQSERLWKAVGKKDKMLKRWMSHRRCLSMSVILNILLNFFKLHLVQKMIMIISFFFIYKNTFLYRPSLGQIICCCFS